VKRLLAVVVTVTAGVAVATLLALLAAAAWSQDLEDHRRETRNG
jgi:hypothetical protein